MVDTFFSVIKGSDHLRVAAATEGLQKKFLGNNESNDRCGNQTDYWIKFRSIDQQEPLRHRKRKDNGCDR